MKKPVLFLLTAVSVVSLSACGHTHTWTDATCEMPMTCSECGETEGEALGHTWTDATCTAPKTCSECNETEGEALGHTVESWSVSKEAACTEEGEETGVCTRCNATVQQSIPKVEHTPGEWTVSKAATSDSAGQRTQSCTVCGEQLNTEEFTLSPEELEAQYKSSCTAYSYDTIARDPDKYIGTYGKYTGEVVQVLEDGNDVQMRVNITKERYFYTDTIYVQYTKQGGESRFLEDDIITIYGMNAGTVSYESVLGATITLPLVYAEYIEVT
jgi:hypothetical protein